MWFWIMYSETFQYGKDFISHDTNFFQMTNAWYYKIMFEYNIYIKNKIDKLILM